jgi:hypothetical protein
LKPPDQGDIPALEVNTDEELEEMETDVGVDTVFTAASMSLIPNYQPPNQQIKNACSHLYLVMSHWQLEGCPAVMLGALRNICLAGADTDKLIENILGGELLAGWYPSEENPLPEAASSVLPRQLMCFLASALEQMKSFFDLAEQTQRDAKVSYQQLRDNSRRKKARVVVVDSAAPSLPQTS